MAYNPQSARQLPANDPLFDSKPSDLSVKSITDNHKPSTQYTDEPSQVIGQAPNKSEDKPRPKADPALYTGRLPQTVGPPGGYIPLVQSSTPQPPSVKHLTCWYWANKGCKLADDVCLYAHFDTGRLADPPVKIQRGRPAVAGKNATNPQPVFKDWKGHHRANSAVFNPRVQRQIERIHAKAAQHSTPRPVQAEQSGTANMVNQGVFGFAQPKVNFNRPHSDDHPSPPPADSYRNLSIGFEAPSQPFSQPFVQYPHQARGHFMAPSPSAHYTGGFTQDDLGSYYGMGDIYGGMGGGNLTNYGPGPYQFGGNSPNDPTTFASPGQFRGQSEGPTQAMQKQLEVKDKVITELAEIVEMLEVNYGISIDDQTDTLEKFLKIARAMEEDEKKAREGEKAGSSGMVMGKYPHQWRAPEISAAGTSAPSYNRPPVNHKHIHAAMQGFLNLVKMEKMVLAKTKARKHAIGEDLERIEAKRLLPGGWVER